MFGHVETPARVASTVARLRRERHEWLEPVGCDLPDLLRVHDELMVRSVRAGNFHDPDTPSFPGIFELASLAAGAAVLAAETALAGRRAFSLMRPPGHHATRDQVMGFCYFNNLAVAVAKMLSEHPDRVKRVAILDFDCHHGNGTEDIFAGHEQVLFASLHQSPCYPGTGLASRGNCRNYPLPPGCAPDAFLAALDEALAELRAFGPSLLAVSAGFDSYRGDPITSMALEVETFREIGRRLAAFKTPAFGVLEGGYAKELPDCVAEFLAGWAA